jgi:hypothetical protein
LNVICVRRKPPLPLILLSDLNVYRLEKLRRITSELTPLSETAAQPPVR